MRIYLTSVEESKHTEEIQRIVKSIFPNYSVVTIPNKYATEKGKAEVKAYQKKYNREHKDMINQKRRERYQRQKNEKEMDIMDEYLGIPKDIEKAVKKKTKER